MNKDKEINSLKLEIELLKQSNDRLYNGLWKSIDGIKFEQVSNLINIDSLTIISNGTIWVGTENDGYRSANDDAIYYSLIKKINNGDFD